MNEGQPKPCPMCGEPAITSLTQREASCGSREEKCPMAAYWWDFDQWNTRPVEDALQQERDDLREQLTGCHQAEAAMLARVEDLTAQRDELRARRDLLDAWIDRFTTWAFRADVNTQPIAGSILWAIEQIAAGKLPEPLNQPGEMKQPEKGGDAN